MGGTKVCSNSFGHQDVHHAHIVYVNNPLIACPKDTFSFNIN